MNPLLLATLVFVIIFGATLLGMRLNARLPAEHRSGDTKDAVRIGMGLVATMAALILGLLVASASNAYDTEKSEITQMAAKIAFLDGVLINYGPDARPARRLLRRTVQESIARIWSDDTGEPTDPASDWSQGLPKAIQILAAENDAQRTFRAQAADLVAELGQLRWLLFEQESGSTSHLLLAVVVAWLAIIFGSVGLFSPRNATAVVALLLAAISVSGAILLILEFDRPFDGLIKISDGPMVNALQHLTN